MDFTTAGFKWMTMAEAQSYIPDSDAAEENNRLFPYFVGTWCKYIHAATFFNQIEDGIIITHGPNSCVAAAKNFKQTNYSLHAGEPYAHMVCTELDELALIMGQGEAQLRETILRTQEIYSPSVITILDTCAGYMIGDDIQGVIEQVRDNVTAKLLYVPSPGFAGVTVGVAMPALAPCICELMEPQETNSELVNVLGLNYDSGFLVEQGRKYPSDVQAYKELVEGIGLKFHRILMYGDYEYIRTAPAAGVNAIHSAGWGYPVAREMEARFGTKWLRSVHPVGLGPIRRWVEELAMATGKEENAATYLSQQESLLLPVYEKAKKALENKVLLVECSRNAMARFADALAYARLGADLGMQTYIFNCHPMEFKADKDDVDSFLEDGYNAQILIGPYAYQSPVNVPDVMQNLGLDRDQCVYIYDVVFPYARAGHFDPANVAKHTISFDMKRVKGASYRGAGYAGAAQTYAGMLEALQVAKRVNKPTLYGRVQSSIPFDFQADDAGKGDGVQ